MNHRKKPSDLPYRATRWTDAAAHFISRFEGLIILVLLIAGMIGITALLVSAGSPEQRDAKCKARCHPVASLRAGGECWCTPKNESAYLAGLGEGE